MNNVNLIGRLTDQPTLRYSQGGAAVSNFGLAVNGKKKQGNQWVDDVDYFDCTLFGNQAEKLQQYLGKGKQVGISGRLKQQRWQDNGQNRSKVTVIVDRLDLLGGRDDGQQGGYQQRPQQEPAYAVDRRFDGPETFRGDNLDGSPAWDDDRIPF